MSAHGDTAALRAFLAEELARPAQPAATAMAAALAQEKGAQVAAVLFYGSCLRSGALKDMMLDFYLLVDDYAAFYGARLPAWGNAACPPNVYYHEWRDGDGTVYRAKYAVYTLADFAEACLPQARSISVWARFAQPARLVWARDDSARHAVVDAAAEAVTTFVQLARPLAAQQVSIADFWAAGFAATYGAELRAEAKGRPGLIVEQDAGRYAQITPLALQAAGLVATVEDERIAFARDVPGAAVRSAQAAWRVRQRRGKWISVVRLIKAAFTFDGGIDYLAWKIERHAGTPVQIKPWHRRVPALAGLIWFVRLRLRGAVR